MQKRIVWARFIFRLIQREIEKDAKQKLHEVGHKSRKSCKRYKNLGVRMNFRLGAQMSQEGEEAPRARQEKQFNKRLETRQTSGQWEAKPVRPPRHHWLARSWRAINRRARVVIRKAVIFSSSFDSRISKNQLVRSGTVPPKVSIAMQLVAAAAQNFPSPSACSPYALPLLLF